MKENIFISAKEVSLFQFLNGSSSLVENNVFFREIRLRHLATYTVDKEMQIREQPVFCFGSHPDGICSVKISPDISVRAMRGGGLPEPTNPYRSLQKPVNSEARNQNPKQHFFTVISNLNQ